MNQVVRYLRLLLILVSIIATLYTGEIESYSVYTFLTLLYIGIDRLHDLWKHEYMENGLRIVQIIFIYLLDYTYQGLLYILFFASLFTYHRDLKKPIQILLLTVQWLVMNISLFNEPVSLQILSNIMYVVILTALFLVVNVTRQNEEIQFLYDSLRQKHFELDEARHRLIDYTKKVEDVVFIEERNRIAKDIHDEIGHKLIRIKMMMEALIRIIPSDREKAMEMIYTIRDQLAESMETLRLTVQKMKPSEHQIKRFSIKKLTDDFAHDSGIQVNYDIAGVPRVLYPSIEVALYRNAQEALTNSIRHGKATQVDILLDYKDKEITMSIRNNGHLPDKNMKKGLGLIGMEERVEILGGSIKLQIGNRFEIVTTIPYDGK